MADRKICIKKYSGSISRLYKLKLQVIIYNKLKNTKGESKS